MPKDWSRYQSDIRKFYLTEGKSLNEVRRLIKGKYNFQASPRSYRKALDGWGYKKKDHRGMRSRTGQALLDFGSSPVFGPSDGMSLQIPLSDPTQIDLNMDHYPQTTLDPFTSPTPWPRHTANDNAHAPLDFHLNLTGRSSNLPLDEQDAEGRTKLHHAVLRGTTSEVRNLLSSGANVFLRDNLGDQPLHLALYADDIQNSIVQLLINFGAPTDTIGSTGKTPIHHAVRSYSTLLILLKSQPKLSLVDSNGNTPLHQAAFDLENTEEAYRRLLEFGADPNAASNATGETPFHIILGRSSKSSYVSLVIFSIMKGAGVLIPGPRNRLPFEIYIENIREDLVKTVSSELEREKVVSSFEHFFEFGASPDTKLLSGQYLCHYLVENEIFRSKRNPSLGRLMCEKVDVNSRGLEGNTPLLALAQYSCSSTDEAALKILLKRGSDPNALNDQGWSPLWLALGRPGSVQRRYPTPIYVKLLVESGAISVCYNPLGELTIYVTSEIAYFSLRFQILKILLASFADTSDTIQFPDKEKDRKWLAEFAKASTVAKTDWSKADFDLHNIDSFLPDPPREHIPSVARIVLAEHALKYHRDETFRIKDEETTSPDQLSESRRQFFAVLRGCRDRNIEIEPIWYKTLLDVLGEDY